MSTKQFSFLLIVVFWVSSCAPSYLIKEQKKDLSDYAHTSYDLPEKLEEISGLEWNGKAFLGFNDSGGAAEVYVFNDQSPIEILQTYRLKNTENVDWEDIAQSDTQIFIGDFGNNLGMRKELKVYQFSKNKINSTLQSQDITVDTIGFFYPEQTDFSKQVYNHDFDLEGMVFFQDKLHLFTKAWGTNVTKHYTLDLVNGIQPAWLVEEVKLDFLVTGADVLALDKNYTRLGMVGYTTDGDVYMMLTDFKNTSITWLDQPKSIIYLGRAGDVGQVEGISFVDKNKVCYSAESITWEGVSRKQNLTCISLK